MDGVHDLGGKQGFGSVRFVKNAAVFHHDWELRANALYALCARKGLINMDEYRHAIERMEPRHYLAASYYERSLTGLASLLVEKGFASTEELNALAGGLFPLALPGGPGRSQPQDRAQFKPGDRVRVRSDYVSGHVRMPAYIRGKSGVVISVSPAYPFPDAHAHGLSADDEPTYDVRFQAEELWPEASEPAMVHVGVFESYLLAIKPCGEPAQAHTPASESLRSAP
ncbi:MAG: nitrile hydratase subunit beta [Betaproteobacteria bacterium]|nr:nitrile hydratase subunit beta [Betaproteobacteria bacterium]NBS20938.1 nitrile hydratase subunit beta [Betaproteobacteria bacterium]NCV32091.1 nitrile hydratase subunit beta [Betaproteobacteria bacterium]NCX12043.1 nitrile hydratase subunit beta [Betaproteobacteria bacterium]NCZ99388.1 nitrile hydratase subunit beta [Betaproteobacteria bacterium]